MNSILWGEDARLVRQPPQLKTASSDPILPWIWRFLRPYRGRVVALSLLSAAEVGLRILSPWPLKVIVDNVIGAGPAPATPGIPSPAAAVLAFLPDPRERLIVAFVAAGLLIQLAHQLVMMFHARLSCETGHRMLADLRERLFAHLQALRLSDHATMPTGDIVYRVSSDAACLEHLVIRGLFPIVFSVVTLVLMLAVLIRVDVTLAVVSLAVAPAMYLWLRFYTRRMQPEARRARELESSLVQRVHETMATIALVKTYAREDFEQRRFVSLSGTAVAARVRTARQEALFSAVINGLTVAGTSVIVLVGSLSVMNGRISLGTLLLALSYLAFIYGPLCAIANTTGALQQAIVGARRVRETLATEPESIDSSGGLPAEGISGAMEFEHVTSSYGREGVVLDDMSFAIRPGEMVAIVGPSGAGKTTAVSLMVRLYDALSGRILLDGVDVRQFNVRSLRRVVAVVAQQPLVVSGTIRQNLRYGRLDASDADIERAARAADAHDFISALPQGYETVLGEGGVGLSGGQRQRLSIARAFLKNAPILIFDEPTSALDGVSERLVFDGLRSLHGRRTTVVIAHRLSTVVNADRILVFDRGRLVAQGRHDELLSSSPLYARLAQLLSVSTEAAA